MIQLIYTSISTDPITRELLDDICGQSIANNKRDEITGLLMTRGDRFLQAIEGPKTTVEDTFIRIITDPRHHGVHLLARNLITQRQFGSWEMGGHISGEDEAEIYHKIKGLVEQSSRNAQDRFSDYIAANVSCIGSRI